MAGKLGLSDSEARVAVVIPCFNDGATVEEAAASVLAGAPAVELVIVDDGSTDSETVDVLKRLEESGIAVIRQQQNSGPSVATMKGFLATSARYFMRFDADDVLEPGALEDLANTLDRSPHAAAVWGDVQTFGITSFRIPGVRAMDAWLLTYTNCITGGGTLVRRDAIAEAGGWQLKEGWEDWDLWMSLAERGYEGLYVPRVVFRYRREEDGRHAASLSAAESHYADLCRRHQALFTARSGNRRNSTAPRALKTLVPLVDSVPGIPRLTKIHACELLARLLWAGGVRGTMPMIIQASRIRLRRLWRSVVTK